MDTDFLFDMIRAKTEGERDKALSDGLYEMCDSLHSHCPEDECLMRSLGFVVKEKPNSIRWTPFVAVHKEDDDGNKDNYGCPFFKNGSKMLRALKRSLK